MNKDIIIQKIRQFFASSGGQTAVIGISGGKDSTVAAALCAEALGKENVLGVLMPNEIQDDIQDSYDVCKAIGIKSIEVNIGGAFYSITKQIESKLDGISLQSMTNLPPRLRMAVLYAAAQSVDGGRVINTSNACEAAVGWGTLFGDTVGDFAPLKHLTVSEIVELGLELGLPEHLVKKTPADGLTGKSDEDNLGVSYAAIEKYIKGNCDELSKNERDIIEQKQRMSEFKRMIIHVPGVMDI